MMFWPAYWTHPHKGIPAPKETKYIVTGWFFLYKNIILIEKYYIAIM